MTNRLINETSPYLLQHAHNPVDWFPWGKEALEKAKIEDKPILLSIGYSACHWCHVMEKESFEDQEIAKTMSSNFVCIKVDREERPDLDAIYMQAVQALTGHGGWPMTVFLTPDGEPFYGGTYFPPQDRGGMPGFLRVITAMDEIYKQRRDDVVKASSHLVKRLQQMNRTHYDPTSLTHDTLKEAFLHLMPGIDQENGGFGGAPKFPQPMIYDFLLKYHHFYQDKKALEFLNLSLEKMALGGMYDQLAGGFHRYSTDSYWLVPHFEKMLYDNALLSLLYLHAFQATGHELYLRILEETMGYVLREMTSEEGGFYSSQDADSEGEEGKFFVWDLQEIDDALGVNDSMIFSAYYDVTKEGNFEAKNILNVPVAAETIADNLDISPKQLEGVLQRGNKILLKIRETRKPPDRDDKIIAAWNGLMLKSFAEAAAILQNDEYKKAAISNGKFIIEKLYKNGDLLRTYRNGLSKVDGFLEDYACVADGFITLYQLTFDQFWMDTAHSLVDRMIYLFWDETDQVFYDTSRDHEKLLIRPREIFDNAIPCGASVAVEVLLKLSLLVGNPSYRSIGVQSLRSMGPLLSQYPHGMGRWLSSLIFHLKQPKEIAIVGHPDSSDTLALLKAVHSVYMPDKIIAGMKTDDKMGRHPFPLLRFKTKIEGQSAAYVCHNYVCRNPTIDPHDLSKQLVDFDHTLP